ncbi:hypothetical protein LX36DRAFT_685718 [Colletotrichum falcatum]|nr:hypothetical protein LX36DRAFT_685718 [Colletotrichum falcatum]
MKDGRGRDRGRSGRRIPMEFNIFNSGIAETADKPLFCLSNDEEPSDNHLGINLHAGPFDVHPKIANLTHRTVVRTGWKTMRTMDVVLFETAAAEAATTSTTTTTTDKGEAAAHAKVVLEQQMPWSPLGRLLRWRSAAAAARWAFTMRIPLRGEGRPAEDVDFEWRHSRGLTVRRLRGADGWMLWRRRTAEEARRTGTGGGGGGDDGDELVALVSRSGSRPHLGTRFAFAGAAARGELGDGFSVVALMSGIGVVLAQRGTLGDCVDALEITARRRSMLARAAAAERQAREARAWVDTMDLMEEGAWGEEGQPSRRRSDRVRAWREQQQQQQQQQQQASEEGGSRGASSGTPQAPDPAMVTAARASRRGGPSHIQPPGTPRSARTTRPLSTSTRTGALTPGRRTASNRSRLYERESERFVENTGGIHID